MQLSDHTLLSVIVLMASSFCVGENTGHSADEIGEYCQHETMKGRCRWKSEVIVMTSARWGRMKTGRCLNIHPNFLAMHGQDPMFLGCAEDVISIADRKCSGRSECDIRIPDPELDTVTPCYPDQKSYLAASYTCVKVVQESRSCTVSVTGEQQFIARSSSIIEDATSSSNCGSRSHPWRLLAPVGQRINVSLINFTPTSSPPDDDVTSCHQYGYIVEKSSKKNVTICPTAQFGGAKSHQRESEVYASESNTVDIVLPPGARAQNYNFLLRINAVGCTNMIPPDNAWLKRSNNDIVIGCYLSQQTWQLKCDGQEWKGLVGECRESYNVDAERSYNAVPVVQADSTKSKMFLIMVIIAGGAVIICIVVITIGITCLYRCKNAYKKSKQIGHHTKHEDTKFVTSSNHSSPGTLLES